MDHAGLVCARRRSVRQHDSLQARAAGGSRVGRRFNLPSSKPTSLLAVAAAAAATIVSSSSGVHARDSFTVSAGYQHTCIVTADADVKCFGYNKNGELGLGDTSSRGDGSTGGGMGDDLGTVNLGTGAAATAVSSGWQHTCALLEGGAVKCWGRNDKGQLGYGDYLDRGDDPLTMGDNLTAIDLGSSPSGNGTAVATAVTTGQQFTCVLVEGGGVKCFGRNDEGQCGRGNLDENVGSSLEDMGDGLPYVDLGEGVEAVSISSGTSTTCAALLGGGIKCWGGNAYGGLGVGDPYNAGDEPTDMGDNLREVDLGTGEVGQAVVCGLRHACAIVVGGKVKCWGDNRSGQLGLGHVDSIGDDSDEMGDNLPFVDLGPGATATSLSLAESHTCAILGDGTTRCWGKSFRGQLGRGEYYARGKYPGEMGTGLVATDLGANATVSSLAAGGDHTCAALGDGSLKCWGMNTVGALGLGDTQDRGDDVGEMGDALPAVSLGTGVTVAVDAGATPAPTPAPTTAPTPQATPSPTAAAPSPQPTATAERPDVSSPQPSPSPTPQPTPEPTPSPTEAAVSREIETADDGDSGVFTTENVTVAAYVAVPLVAFALLACFCAVRRRRRSDSDDGSAGAWAGGSSAKGAGGGAAVAAAAGAGVGAAAGHRATDSGGKVFPSSRSFSPRRGPDLDFDVEDMNLAEHIVVGASAAGGAGAGAGRREQGVGAGKSKTKTENPKKFARCESDTAFAVTSSEDIPDNLVSGRGGESDSSGGAGTGRSSSPPGYEDDEAASVFDSGEGGVENGWEANKTRNRPPSYEETRRREEHVGRSLSNRGTNSERALARGAARAGRQAAPLR